MMSYSWFSIKNESEAFVRCAFAYNKLYIWLLNADIFNVLLFKLFCVLWETGRHKKYLLYRQGFLTL